MLTTLDSNTYDYFLVDYFRYLDEIHMMCYDFHGAWETFTGHNAPLYRNPNIDTDGDYIVFNPV